MKPLQIKRVALGVLLLILAYVWWGNLRLMTDQPIFDVSGSDAKGYDGKVTESAALEFSEPKTNPFRRYLSVPPSPTRSAAPMPSKVPEFPPPSTRYRLIGALVEHNQSQAVFLDEAATSTVLALKDSLMSWTLVGISDTIAIFAKEKQRDTLVLQGNR
jgi:hypothetical protein